VDLFRVSLGGSEPQVGLSQADVGSMERSFSSGFIVHADGQVLTSEHAVHDAQEAWVLTADGRRFPATLTGFDRQTDVAILKVSASRLPVVQLASNVSLCAGEPIAAVGAPFGLERSATAGVISAYPRFLPGNGAAPWIQTDVAMNPGSSGGPVINADGVVIGMSTMIYTVTGIFMGVSFALPIDRVMHIARQLASNGLVQRGHIGATIQPVSSELADALGLQPASGVVVLSVESGGPADVSGLRGGDVLLSVNVEKRESKAIGSESLNTLNHPDKASSPIDIEHLIFAAKPGSVLALTVWRQGALKSLRLAVAAAPVQLASRTIPKRAHSIERLGLTFVQNNPSANMPIGIYVDTVAGASLVAGIEFGDRIIAVNHLPVLTSEDFDNALKTLSRHESVALLVERDRIRWYMVVRKETQ
jgi:serine protease Do